MRKTMIALLLCLSFFATTAPVAADTMTASVTSSEEVLIVPFIIYEPVYIG